MILKKYFISEYKEEKWLNSLGKMGYLLESKRGFDYEFKKIERPVRYYIDYLTDAPESEESKEYLENKNAVAFKGNSVYVVSDGDRPYEAYSRQTKRYGKLALFFGILFVLFCALFVYNIKNAMFFKDIGYVVPNDKNAVLDIFRFVIGKNPAQMFMILLVLILFAVAGYTLVFYFEYLNWKKELKNKKQQNEEVGE